MYIVSCGSVIVKVSNEGHGISIYESLIVKDLNLVLEVHSITSKIITCVAIGSTKDIKCGMQVTRTNKTFSFKFHKNLIGRVLNPKFEILEGKKGAEVNSTLIYPRDSKIDLLNVDGSVNIAETGIKAVDMFCPYVPGGKIGVVGGAGVGKEQPLDSLVRTPSGWSSIDSLLIGDEICNSYGSVSIVEGIFPQGKKDVYKVTFEDERVVECGADHLWKVFVKTLNNSNSDTKEDILAHGYEAVVLETNKLQEILNKTAEVCVPLCQPVVGKYSNVFLNSYSFGALIGSCLIASNSVYSSNDDVIFQKIKYGLGAIGFNIELGERGIKLICNKLVDNKYLNFLIEIGICTSEIYNVSGSIEKYFNLFIPEFYINNSPEEKIKLIHGIFDIASTILDNGSVIVENLNNRLSSEIQQILWALGSICNRVENGTDIFEISAYNNNIDIFLSPERKIKYFNLKSHNCSLNVKIKSIDLMSIKKEMACIKVSATDSLYITNDYIVTHNTTLILELIRNMRSKNVFTIFSGVGERVREGHLFYNEMIDAGLIDVENPSSSDIAIIFGNMDQTPSIRSKAALSSIALAEHIRDRESRDVLFLMDNVFRYAQSENEISASLGLMPSELGYQPNLFYDMSLLQERIFSTVNGKSITSVQAIYVPADDNNDPAVISIMRHMDSCITLSRDLASQGIFPAIDPLESMSFVINESVLGERHYGVYKKIKKCLSRYSELLNIINIVGLENISDEDKVIVARAKLIYSFMTQPLKVTEQFLDCKGEFVTLEETISGFEKIIEGHLDNISPEKLYMIGSLKDF